MQYSHYSIHVVPESDTVVYSIEHSPDITQYYQHVQKWLSGGFFLFIIKGKENIVRKIKICMSKLKKNSHSLKIKKLHKSENSNFSVL